MSRLPESLLPSPEEAERAVREGEKMIEQLAAARKGKLPRTDPQVRTAAFTRLPLRLRKR